MLELIANHLVESQNTPKKILWGVAPTGDPHFGYLLPLYILKRLQEKGTEVFVLIANWHGYLDSNKTEWQEIQARTDFYKDWFKKVGFSNSIETNDFYTKPEYFSLLIKTSPYFDLDGLIACGNTTLKNKGINPTSADVYYLHTQIIDPIYLEIDTVLCAVDEAPIYVYGIDVLKKKSDSFYRGIYTDLSPAIASEEMHSSMPGSNKIMLSDTPHMVIEKIKNHFEHSEKNAVELPLYQYIKKYMMPYIKDEKIINLVSHIEKNSVDKTYIDVANLINLIINDVQYG